MSDEDGLVDAEHVEQAGEIAGQVFEVESFDDLRGVAGAKPTHVGCDHPEAGVDQRPELLAPRVRNLGPAVAQHDGRTRSGVVNRECDLGKRGPLFAGMRGNRDASCAGEGRKVADRITCGVGTARPRA